MNHGQLEMIVGPMFAGKSTELIRRIRLLKAARKKWLLVTHLKDDRYFGTDDVMGTHDRVPFPARKVTHLSEIKDETLEDIPTLVIDEGQFFPDLPTQVWHWISVLHKHVIVAALNGTFQRKPFDNVSPLYAMQARVQHLNAVCTCCGNEAPFTRRLTREGDGYNDAVLLVGGSERYEARCMACFDL